MIVLAAIGLNLYDGDGVHDSGILGSPSSSRRHADGKRTAPYLPWPPSPSSSGGAAGTGYVHPTIRPRRRKAGADHPAAGRLGDHLIIIDVVERNLQRARSKAAPAMIRR
jgi:hypothetical protein